MNAPTPELERLHAMLSRYVDQRQIPGLIALVSHDGDTWCDVLGTRSFGGKPMTRDTIFRITSMTKPMVAVAVMMLVEQGVLALDEPVERFLSELANMRVLRRIDGPPDDTVPAQRSITTRDLLTFRQGIGVMMVPDDDYPILRAIDEQKVMLGPPIPRTPYSIDEWLRRMGSLPLMAQPGERWLYNTGADLQGALVARASGQTLDVFMQERIFAPLGMNDTGFFVPADDLGRLTACYSADESGAIEQIDQDTQWSQPPLFPTGRDGLVSTVDDVLKFAQMMLNDGMYNGGRLLEASTVRQMTTNHLTPEQQAGGEFLDGRGWGFGMAVVTDGSDRQGPVGAYGWDGGFGTTWKNDPTSATSAILLTQCSFAVPAAYELITQFWSTLYPPDGNAS